MKTKGTIKAGDVVRRRATGVLLAVGDCDEKHVSCVWFGIDGSARWTGPYRRRFRRSEFELVQAPRGRRLSR